MGQLIMECMDCNDVYDVKPDPATVGEAVSHGICPQCSRLRATLAPAFRGLVLCGVVVVAVLGISVAVMMVLR